MKKFSISSHHNYDCWGKYDDTTYYIENDNGVRFSTNNEKDAKLLCVILNTDDSKIFTGDKYKH